jgi:hypothetical protein
VSVGEQPIGQREFDRYREATDRELARLTHDQRQHEKWHEDEAVREAADVQHRREWTWQRILGIIAATAAVLGLELQYIAHR